MFHHDALAKTRLSVRGFLVSPRFPKTRLLRMHRDTPTARRGRTRLPKRASGADRAERKGLGPGGGSAKRCRCLPGRTRDPGRVEVKSEVALDKLPLPRDFFRNLRQQVASGLGKRRAGRPAPISAVSGRLAYRQRSQRSSRLPAARCWLRLGLPAPGPPTRRRHRLRGRRRRR